MGSEMCIRDSSLTLQFQPPLAGRKPVVLATAVASWASLAPHSSHPRRREKNAGFDSKGPHSESQAERRSVALVSEADDHLLEAEILGQTLWS